ncbi:hypothetical protein R6Q59_002985 [Mikania micrantha]
MPATHKKVYRTKGYKARGQILSWAYFHDLGCYAVKRERGIDYFKHRHDFKTLPGFEVNQLARLKMLYSEDSGMSAWFSRQIQLGLTMDRNDSNLALQDEYSLNETSFGGLAIVPASLSANKVDNEAI